MSPTISYYLSHFILEVFHKQSMSAVYFVANNYAHHLHIFIIYIFVLS